MSDLLSDLYNQVALPWEGGAGLRPSEKTDHQIVCTVVVFALIWMSILSFFMCVLMLFLYMILMIRNCFKKCFYKTFNKLKTISKPPGDNFCAICFEELSGNCYQTLCNHCYHRSCLNKYIDKKIDDFARRSSIHCPICREKRLLYLL